MLNYNTNLISNLTNSSNMSNNKERENKISSSSTLSSLKSVYSHMKVKESDTKRKRKRKRKERRSSFESIIKSNRNKYNFNKEKGLVLLNDSPLNSNSYLMNNFSQKKYDYIVNYGSMVEELIFRIDE